MTETFMTCFLSTLECCYITLFPSIHCQTCVMCNLVRLSVLVYIYFFFISYFYSWVDYQEPNEERARYANSSSTCFEQISYLLVLTN